MRTLWSDFIVSAIDQVDALSAAVPILSPVEICLCVIASEFCVARSDWRAVIAEGFVKILDMTHRSLVGETSDE
jgi:hypothetical protein